MQKSYLLNVKIIKVKEKAIVMRKRRLSIRKFGSICKKNIKKLFNAWIIEQVTTVRPSTIEVVNDYYYNATDKGIELVSPPELNDSIYIAFQATLEEDKKGLEEDKKGLGERITAVVYAIDLVQSLRQMELRIAEAKKKK